MEVRLPLLINGGSLGTTLEQYQQGLEDPVQSYISPTIMVLPLRSFFPATRAEFCPPQKTHCLGVCAAGLGMALAVRHGASG
jgi:hypothetical protein